ncbi:MAG: 4Fe-4S dicluster domain-containing protein [Proteobacteria bacterium]|nr:4Fe-4S dicluster domain-containing protein [Pseudomonadota bacterium]MBU4294380.1 4Fe-4S dicluster domain-containing protein [Pseudomonadota bacterium]MCG2749446.1 4Fe-4S dicluster domain-containing protein [Desulfobulbaceae bacterium]
MSVYAMVKDASPTVAVKAALTKLLSQNLVDAVLVAAKSPYSALPMPTLFAEASAMDGIDPLAPAAPFNAARQAATVSRQATGKRLALVLRPCEIRALIELVKLNQCTLENVVLIGIDCLGRMENEVFLRHASALGDVTSEFQKNTSLQDDITRTCQMCEQFEPAHADIAMSTLGMAENSVLFASGSETGEALLKELGLSPAENPAQRETVTKQLREKRAACKKEVFAETSEKINSIEKFEKMIGTCLNCYNCRQACPVCYCRECVFLTDVFAARPETLLRRAQKRGSVKLPTDTTMFHLTRLSHIAHSCVGCGQCSSVCPSNIPVADIFTTVAAQVQAAYDYVPGRDVQEPIPYLIFAEKQKSGEPK